MISPPPLSRVLGQIVILLRQNCQKNERGIQHKNPPQQKGNSSHFWQLWSNFWASPTFFSHFLQLIRTYHVFFILDYPHFIIFCVFFWVKMHIIPIFYQIFSIFLIFDNFDLIFGPPLLFFQFFSTNNNLSYLLYFRLPSFYNFLCIYLGHNAYNTNFFTKFS